MRKDLITSLLAVIVLTVFLGLVYPLAITGISQVLFPGKANGSKLSVNGRVVGSSLIGQPFSHPVLGKNGKPKFDDDEEEEEILAPDKGYFQPRPSATGYSGNVTYFGNAGPNSAEAREEVRENLASYVALEKPYDKGLSKDRVPVDAVTQSASGVDPHISEANALVQAHRIAAVRRLSLSQVEDLISASTDGRSLGLFGEPGVNVLELNIALDKEAPLK
ncbi:MAG TPA: potassium-transporting ATPase subunit C [Solirubrobacterales bacterium]|jgi:K+-transporting ATPase ATPase C chain|nr:potassium-transporting ATPase subunit C [Solirubrobacterales bacterium]